jgi:dienelactone hydrolase
MREQIWRIPVPARRGAAETVLLEATLFRPPGSDLPPRPILVINHGQPEDMAQRQMMERPRYPNAARVFLAEGWIVLLPLRRGFGGSQGEFLGGTGGCERMDLNNNAQTAASDIEHVVRWIPRNMPFADAERVVLVGQSAGGLGVLAALGRPVPGVRAGVNFAGGLRAGNRGSCDGWQEKLVETMRNLGGRARDIPTLWLYARKDSFFGFGLGQRLHAAWLAGGGTGRFLEPSFAGRDGHALFPGDQSIPAWRGPVLAFIREALAPR